MSNPLENRNGYRNIWPFVPVYSPELEGWYDSNAFNGRGNAWIRKVAEKPTSDEIRVIQEAFAIDPSNLDEIISLDPNDISHATVIAPLRKLGLIDDDEIERIINEAEISIGVSGTAGTTTLVSLLEKIKDSNGVVKSSGLKVLDELEATGTLTRSHRFAIVEKKDDFACDAVADIARSIGLGRE